MPFFIINKVTDMKPIIFKNSGELVVRLTSTAGHVCSIAPGEEKAIPAILRGEALKANLTCMDKKALEEAGNLAAEAPKKSKGVSTKAQKAAAEEGKEGVNITLDQE